MHMEVLVGTVSGGGVLKGILWGINKLHFNI